MRLEIVKAGVELGLIILLIGCWSSPSSIRLMEEPSLFMQPQPSPTPEPHYFELNNPDENIYVPIDQETDYT